MKAVSPGKNGRSVLLAVLLLAGLLSSCGASDGGSASAATGSAVPAASQPAASTPALPSDPARDNTPVVYENTAPGGEVYGNTAVAVDCTNKADGYFMAIYTGGNPKVKLQVTGPSGATYTYTLHGWWEAFPLAAGNGTYSIGVFENLYSNAYTPILYQSFYAELPDSVSPYRRPNQYVNYNADSNTVAVAKELAADCETDLEVVGAVYNYVISAITYDDYKAATVQAGYTPDVDGILSSGYGICFDYASVMAAMLRSQRIPTCLQVGYSGGVYHAWVSVYIEDAGWINGIIQFDGTSWKLMDPTFADNAGGAQWIMDYIANTGNYQIKYRY